MIKKLHTIEEFLQQLKDDDFLILDIPDHPLISKAEEILTEPDEIQRFYLFIYHTFTLKRSYLLRPYKIQCGELLLQYECLLFSDFLKCILSSNKELYDRIFDTLKDLDIIKVSRTFTYFKFFQSMNIYMCNSDICNTSVYKRVRISARKPVNANFNYLMNRYDKISSVQKRILNKNIIRASVDISREEFDSLYFNPKLEARKIEDIPKKYNKSTQKYYKPTREEYINDFKVAAEIIWDKIECSNSDIKFLRFLDCKEDYYGHRFFHTFINIPKVIRWNIRMDKINKMFPLFEIDVIASQPTFNALWMQKEGYIDEEYFKDINSISPDYYGQLANRLGKNISRDVAKGLSMKLLFGKTGSPIFKRALTFYKTFTKFLSIMKSRTAEELDEQYEDLNNYSKNINLSASNCIHLQREESTWASNVWNRLLENNIRFIPVHDSVIIFGYKNITELDAIKLSRKVSQIMIDCFELKNDSKVTPHLKTTFNPNIYPITNQEIT